MISAFISGGGLLAGAVLALWFWRKATAAEDVVKVRTLEIKHLQDTCRQTESELELTRSELTKRDTATTEALKAKDDTIARLHEVIRKSKSGGDLLDAIGADPNAWLRGNGEDR